MRKLSSGRTEMIHRFEQAAQDYSESIDDLNYAIRYSGDIIKSQEKVTLAEIELHRMARDFAKGD